MAPGQTHTSPARITVQAQGPSHSEATPSPLQLVEVLFADDDVPRDQFVLGTTGRIERVVVTNRVECRARVCVRNPHQEHPAETWIHRSGGDQHAISL